MAFFTRKKIPVLLHVAAWSVLLLLPTYFIGIEQGRDRFFVQMVIVRTFIYVVLFYLNFFWLIPGLLFKNKKWQYYITLLLLITSFYVANISVNRFLFEQDEKNNRQQIENVIKEHNIPKRGWQFDIYNYIFTSILISGFSIGLRMTGRFNENEQKRKELEKEKLGSELAFLKNQVSPHFFFNTLNNIYSLTEINVEEARNSILQLSKLMRYLLYESEKGDTRLSSEIDFMKNYIELMKLRLSDKVDLKFSFPAEYKDFTIPPLLFVSFIENAFKHGISYREPSFIYISLSIHENAINFVCKNSIFKSDESKDGPGIGLENIKKRLSILFPGRHSLSITQEEKVFSVILIINF
ncbi:MAG: histidine kinase [Bacteroidales bacterium]